MHGLTYRELLAARQTRAIAAAALAARVSQGMVVLVVLLLVERHASYAHAAKVAAAMTLTLGVCNPLRGRAADRFGIARVSVCMYVGYVLSFSGFVAAVDADAPDAVIVACASLCGALLPPLGSAMRVLWREAVAENRRQAALAFDTALIDVGFVVGPPLAVLLVGVAGPVAAVVVILTLVGLAVGLVSRLQVRRHPAPPTAARSFLGPIAARHVRLMVLAAALVNAAVAAAEIALVGWATSRAMDWAAGALLAAFAVGSVLGSLSYGRRIELKAASARVPRLAIALAGGLLLLAAATQVPPVLVLACPIAGAMLGPALTVLFTAAADAAPDGAATETQAWIVSGMSAGWATGGAVVGGFAQSQPGLAVATGAGAALLAALVARAAATTTPGVPQPA